MATDGNTDCTVMLLAVTFPHPDPWVVLLLKIVTVINFIIIETFNIPSPTSS